MPTYWTLEYSGTEQTLADWGIQAAVLKRLSQASDEFTFQTPGKAVDADALFPYLAEITIRKERTLQTNGTFTGGSKWFVGRRKDVPRHASGAAEGHTYRFLGPWDYFDEHIFQQQWNIYTDPVDPANSLAGGFRSHVILNQGDNGSRLNTAEQITAAVNYAITQCAAPIAIDATLPAVEIPFDEQREITIAEVIRKQLRWLPDAVTWWDYAAATPTLYVKQRGSLPAVAFDMTAGDTIESWDIIRRDDLKRPAVVLKFESINSINGAPWMTATEQIAPGGATGTEYGALVLTIQLQGFASNLVSLAITSGVINTASATWWKSKIKWLADPRVQGLVISDITGHGALANELLDGQIAPWMGKTVTEETITANATFRMTDSNGNHVGEIVSQPISVKINATDAASGTYRTVESYQDGETVPTGLAAAIYAALSETPFQGQLILLESECSGAIGIGNVLNLTNGHSDWATMNALVQGITEDIDAGRTTAVFGPPTHLGAGDLVELLRVNRNRFVYSNPAFRTSGQGNSGSVALGEQTAKENSNAGHPPMAKHMVTTGAPGSQYAIDLNALLKKLEMTAPTGWGSVKMEHTEDGTGYGTQGHAIQFIELDYCDGGVVRKVTVLGFGPYDPPA